jgi:predicted ferric reductase
MKEQSPGVDRSTARTGALRFFFLLASCLAVPLVLVSLGQRAPVVNLLWDWANALGYLALALGLLLFVYAGRPRAFPPFSGRFFANIHRDFGYIALLLVLLHISLLLYAEPLLVEHLKLTAPVHMLAGLISAVLMLLLVLGSITALRRRLWPDYHRFRVVHAWLSVGVLLLLLIHIVGSAYYLNSVWKVTVCLALAGGVVGQYLDGRLMHLRHDRSVQRLRDTSHYSHWLSYGTVALVSVIALALVWWTVSTIE